MKRSKLFICMMVLVTMLSTTVIGYASEETMGEEEALLQNVLEDQYDDDITTTRAIADIMCVLAFGRDSSMQATANVKVRASLKVDVMISTITLQKYLATKGEYVNTTVDDATQSATNTYGISHKVVYKVSSNGKYRIKVVIKTKEGGVIKSDIFYKKLI